jgi:hypothetical protein
MPFALHGVRLALRTGRLVISRLVELDTNHGGQPASIFDS